MKKHSSSETSFISHIYHISIAERFFTLLPMCFLALLILALLQFREDLFSNSDAIKELNSILSVASLFFGVFFWFSYKWLALMSLKKVAEPNIPKKLISSQKLKVRWEGFSENEFCIILLSEQPTIYTKNSRGQLCTISPVYKYADIAMKLRRILNDREFLFDEEELIVLEKSSKFFKPINVDHSSPSKDNSVLEKKLKAREEWPIDTTRILLMMLEDYEPKQRYSKRGIAELAKTYCKTHHVENGNNYGLSINYVKERWFKELPNDFKK